MGAPKGSTSLESLPTEITILVLLNLPDPSSLRALVRASPLHHELYSHQRRLFLSTALFNSLHYDGLHIALTIQEASIIFREEKDHDSSEEEEDIILRKKKLRCRFFEQPSAVYMSRRWLNKTDFDTIVSILRRYWTITAVASNFIQENLSVNPVTTERCHIYPSPSRSECHRVHRALYYFELYCLLFASRTFFGRSSEYTDQVALNVTENEFSLLFFLPLLESWEVEEVACIRHYVLSQYTKVLQACVSELQQLESRMEEHAFLFASNEDQFDISTPTKLDERKEYLLSLGITFFFAVFFAPTLSAQARLIFHNPGRRIRFLSRAISAYRELEKGDLSENKYNNTILVFTSDNEGPNAALPWSRFSDPEFFYQGREFLRSWGYVMWDRSRLESWKVLEKNVAVWLEDKDVAPRVLLNRWGRPMRH